MMEGVVTVCCMQWNGNTHLSVSERGLHDQTYAAVYTGAPTCPSAKFHIAVLQCMLSVVCFCLGTTASKQNNAIDALEPWLGKWKVNVNKVKTALTYFFHTITWLPTQYSDIQSFKHICTNSEKCLFHSFLSFRVFIRVCQWGFHWVDFHDIWYWRLFRKTFK